MQLYPLKFSPVLKDKIWGGTKMKTVLQKKSDSAILGESWEISGLPGDESIVTNGYLAENSLADLLEIYMGELVGEEIYAAFENNFPLLFKFIDANDNLSIQVHPDDQLAQTRGIGLGKTEMWYVVDAEPGAFLILGFEKDVSPREYQSALENDEVESLLKKVEVKKGDVFFIPAGLVHAIGKGLLIAEIQQSSDTTYRIYDYNRRDDKGNYRDLHISEALEAIDFSRYVNKDRLNREELNESMDLVVCPYFTTHKLVLDNTMRLNYEEIDSFKVYMCLEGEYILETPGNEQVHVLKGETILVPASITELILYPRTKTTLLEVYISPLIHTDI